MEGRELAHLDDQALIKLCLSDNEDAFAEIVNRYKDRVYWLVRRMLGPLYAEDFTQEVFIKVYEGLRYLRDPSQFRLWLYRITYNMCISEMRRLERRSEHIWLDDRKDLTDHMVHSHNRLEEELSRKDFSSLIRSLVESLPAKYSTVLTLYYNEQLRYEEISRVMGIPIGTVKTYLHRARLQLRELVLKRLGEELGG